MKQITQNSNTNMYQKRIEQTCLSSYIPFPQCLDFSQYANCVALFTLNQIN